MLTIRLRRIGKSNQPSYRIVLADKKRSASAGICKEELGFANPSKKDYKLNKDRIVHWIKCGAKPSATVHNLLVSHKIIEGKKIANHAKPKKQAEKQPAAASTAKEAQPQK